MGFLDKARRLAEQVKDKAEDALQDVRARQAGKADTGPSEPAGPVTSRPQDPRLGTPYTPGMLGRPGWREKGLDDPAAVLPIGARDSIGVPRSTKSTILEEPFGMGRRWTAEGRSVGLYYQLYPEHRSWQAPGGLAPLTGMERASTASLDDGRALVFFASEETWVVLEMSGLDDAARMVLVTAVADQVAG